MNKEKFLEEIKDNTLDELELIYETQKDLYTSEEMKIIENKIVEIKEKQEKDKQKKLEKLLPKEIECPKCFGPNRFENEECCFCGYKLDKSKYYNLEYYENEKESKNSNQEYDQESYMFQYIISFLIPIIGFIMGAILLTKDDSKKINIGKRCIIIGILSIVLYIIVISGMILF